VRKFTTLWGKVRTMLNAAKLTWFLRHKLWAQRANLATQLNNILYLTDFDSTPYEMMDDKLPDWIDKLYKYGEIAIVHDGAHAKVRAKLHDKGLVAMFVGYPDNHAGEVCQFLNITTR
jgi:hypothetical protein